MGDGRRRADTPSPPSLSPGERSALSHAITLRKHFAATPVAVPGATAAWAVDGTPADTVMLALHAPLDAGAPLAATVALVVSGINRGDNCGLHVPYSGTLGAAREAAVAGLPALALSLDDHGAREDAAYAHCLPACVALVRAALAAGPRLAGVVLSAGPATIT